jgi:hypothetical protein
MPRMKRTTLLLAGIAAIATAAAAAQHAKHRQAPAENARAGTQPLTLDGQLAALRQGIARYADFEVARKEGWKKFGGDGPLVGEHWYLPVKRGGVDYRHGEALDFSRPSSLMYTDIGGRKVLTGVTFNVRLADGEPVPDGFAGSGDTWHVHDFRAFFAAALDDRPVARWLVERTMEKRWEGRERLAMIHVWAGAIPNPDGPFAHYNRLLPYLKLGLPAAMADGASLESARGLNLATPGGCQSQIDGAIRMAGAGKSVGTRLHQACAEAAEHVRPALNSGDKARINAMAEHSWAMFDSAWNRELTAAQKARIASITEHDHPVPPQDKARHDQH